VSYRSEHPESFSDLPIPTKLCFYSYI